MTSDPWGRVDEQGTVYVKTPEGERPVGSWAAGSPEEALAYFRRKYDGLALEVDLLERRMTTTDLSLKDAFAAIRRLKDSVGQAKAVGDLEALSARLDGLTERVEQRREEAKAAKAAASDEAHAAKERIVEEAERIAGGDDWRHGGQALRDLVDKWKAVPRLDRKTDDALWRRFSAARSGFTKRRKAHFAVLDEHREESRHRKERLVAEAESLAESRDWGPTSSRFRDLMQEWKAAGRARREAEDDLWSRFRAAQDAFFSARSKVFAERDHEQRENQVHKERLLAEAESLLKVSDPRAARSALRPIKERWETIGHVPRDAKPRLEGRLHAVERAIRDAEDAAWRRSNPEARARAEDTVAQLRSSISQLEERAAKARERGRDREADDAASAAAARREWLAGAEHTLADLSGEPPQRH